MFYCEKRDLVMATILTLGVVILFAPLIMLNEYSKDNNNPETNSPDSETAAISNSNCQGIKEPLAGTLKKITFTDKKPRKDCSSASGNLCFSKPFKPVPISKDECTQLRFKLGIKECGYEDDVWAGAAKECGGVRNLPTPEELAELAEVLYKLPCGGHPKIAPKEPYYGKGTFDKNKSKAIGLDSEGYLSMWSNLEAGAEMVSKPGEYAWARNFFPKNSNWYPYERYGKKNARTAVCVYRD